MIKYAQLDKAEEVSAIGNGIQFAFSEDQALPNRWKYSATPENGLTPLTDEVVKDSMITVTKQ